LSVGDVVVERGAVVVVDRVVVVVVVAPPDPAPEAPVAAVEVVVPPPFVEDEGLVVVVAVAAADAGGATNGTVSPCNVVRLVEGPAVRLVHARAAFQLWTAAAAGAPVRGWGKPAPMVAGRQTTAVTWRPSAVMMSAPLSVAGAVLS
jgi:hypothetical protein